MPGHDHSPRRRGEGRATAQLSGARETGHAARGGRDPGHDGLQRRGVVGRRAALPGSPGSIETLERMLGLLIVLDFLTSRAREYSGGSPHTCRSAVLLAVTWPRAPGAPTPATC